MDGTVHFKRRRFKTNLVMGDLIMIIRVMVNQAMSGSNALSSLIQRKKSMVSGFDSISFFHIKREINGQVDYWAKVATSLD